MLHYILIFLCINSGTEAPAQESIAPRISYKKQIITNGILSFGFGAAAYFFHQKGNAAYDRYMESDKVADAIQNWNTVSRYDTYRNICLGGATIFFLRFSYYYIKNIRPVKTSAVPSLDYDSTRRALLFTLKITL